MARWSRGQDAALSRRNHGFESRTSCDCFLKQPNPRKTLEISVSSVFYNKYYVLDALKKFKMLPEHVDKAELKNQMENIAHVLNKD